MAAMTQVRHAVSESPKYGKRNQQKAKDRVCQLLEQGKTAVEAMALVGYHIRTFYDWLRTDPEFKTRVDRIRGKLSRDAVPTVVPDFPEFCETYLGQRLYPHQLQWFDILEGREPRDLHSSQRYSLGFPTHLVVNTPPHHAKSTTITANYVTWRILKDPNIHVILVSKSLGMAKKWLYQIKNRLTNPRFDKLQQDFGPAGGFEKAAQTWQSDAIYFGPTQRDADAKDPTIQALGVGGHIYGSRAHLIVLDDVVVKDNVNQWEQQLEWIQGELISRPGTSGRLLVVGTRMAPTDLYSELLNARHYGDEESPWTYLTQPAVLEFADAPADWKTLWPKSNMAQQGDMTPPGEDGLFVMWDGPSLARQRRLAGPRQWALQYMQEPIRDTAIFPAEAVYGCVNGHRKIGRLAPGVVGVPPGGMAGMNVIAGLDPATTGHTAAVCIALDTKSGTRYVLNVHNQADMTPDGIRLLIQGWTDEYRIQEWRIERNAFQSFLTRDREVNHFLANKGVVLTEHTTGRNKLDPDFGVASMEGLFTGWRDKHNLIDLPSTQNEGVRALCDQLTVWEPETKGKTDCVMALWFAEIRCRELVDVDLGETHLDSRWTTPAQRAAQVVTDLANPGLNETEEDQLTMHSMWD